MRSLQLMHDLEHMMVDAGREFSHPGKKLTAQMACAFVADPMPGVTVDRGVFMAGLWELYGATAPQLSDRDRIKAYRRHVEQWRSAAMCPDC